MLKSLFALPLLFAATALTANIDTEYNMRGHHCNRSTVTLIQTPFLLTPVSNTGFTLSATAAQADGFSIDSNATITLPTPGDYLVSFALNFASDPATQAAQMSMIWNAIGAFELFDSTTNTQVGTVVYFNGTALIHATGPVTISTLFQNFGPIATLVPLNGLLSVKKLSNGKSGRRCGQ